MDRRVVWATRDERDVIELGKRVADIALDKLRYEHGDRYKPAAIFDVDDTLLLWGEGDQISQHPVGGPLFQHMLHRGVAVIILTARVKNEAAFRFLKKQLDRLGYPVNDVSMYFMLPREFDGRNDAGAHFKEAVRKQLAAEGFRFVLNCGDQWGDVLPANVADNDVVDASTYAGIRPAEAGFIHNIKFPVQ